MEEILSYYIKNLIPLLGDDVFFVENEKGRQQPLRSYVVDQFFILFSNDMERDYSDEEKEMMKNSGYYGVSMLRSAFSINFDFEFHYSNIVNNANKIVLHSVVKSYIETLRPRLILTTSPFEPINVLFPRYQSKWFYNGDKEVNFCDISSPTLCHIFGKAGECNVKWVVGEEELLDFLHAWNNGKSLDDSFISKFKEQGLLVLGCDSFPDWIFRFLWYPLGKINKESGKGFLLDTGGTPANVSFVEFLKRINYEKSEDMYKILQAAVDLIKLKQGDEHKKEHDFFISYASEDIDLAKKIQKKLIGCGLDVWLDKERPKELDGKYWNGIETAIENSRYFMPILTKNFVERFFNRERVQDKIIKALEQETGIYIDYLMDKFSNDENKVAKRIIPVLKIGETAVICQRNGRRNYEEKEIELTVENIDILSSWNNENFEIFKEINMYFFSETNPEKDTFNKKNWSDYKDKES